jgi:hypothetical protein
MRDIDDTNNRLLSILGQNPSCSLANWSMRVSRDGLEVVEAELEEWLQGRDYSMSAYMHSFADDDTLDRLVTVNNKHREALVQLLTEYVLRDVGIVPRQKDNPWVSAIETPPGRYQEAQRVAAELSVVGTELPLVVSPISDIFIVP